ncbi:MAG: hypothetical protein ACFFC1_07580, partial [Promethearchaeota archaeon]
DITKELEKSQVFNVCQDSTCTKDAVLFIVVSCYGFAEWGIYSGNKFQPYMRITGYLIKNPPVEYSIKKSLFKDNGSSIEYGCLNITNPEENQRIWEKSFWVGFLGDKCSIRKRTILEFAENLPELELALVETSKKVAENMLVNYLVKRKTNVKTFKVYKNIKYDMEVI